MNSQTFSSQYVSFVLKNLIHSKETDFGETYGEEEFFVSFGNPRLQLMIEKDSNLQF